MRNPAPDTAILNNGALGDEMAIAPGDAASPLGVAVASPSNVTDTERARAVQVLQAARAVFVQGEGLSGYEGSNRPVVHRLYGTCNAKPGHTTHCNQFIIKVLERLSGKSIDELFKSGDVNGQVRNENEPNNVDVPTANEFIEYMVDKGKSKYEPLSDDGAKAIDAANRGKVVIATRKGAPGHMALLVSPSIIKQEDVDACSAASNEPQASLPDITNADEKNPTVIQCGGHNGLMLLETGFGTGTKVQFFRSTTL